jgi:hypothetical protein
MKGILRAVGLNEWLGRFVINLRLCFSNFFLRKHGANGFYLSVLAALKTNSTFIFLLCGSSFCLLI